MLRVYLLISLVLLIMPRIGTSCTILIMGDSISAAYGMAENEGWGVLLETRLNQKESNCKLINSSISGETSAGGLERIDNELRIHNPSILILELGANDGLRGQSHITLKSNLSEIIRRAQATQAHVILLGIRIPPNYGKKYTELFKQTYFQLAEKSSLTLVPYILENIGDNPGLMQKDGIHPNQKAQALIVDRIWPHLKPLLD